VGRDLGVVALLQHSGLDRVALVVRQLGQRNGRPLIAKPLDRRDGLVVEDQPRKPKALAGGIVHTSNATALTQDVASDPEQPLIRATQGRVIA
jgi:hypothetical protein